METLYTNIKLVNIIIVIYIVIIFFYSYSEHNGGTKSMNQESGRR